jgi:hypothetical protein
MSGVPKRTLPKVAKIEAQIELFRLLSLNKLSSMPCDVCRYLLMTSKAVELSQRRPCSVLQVQSSFGVTTQAIHDVG